MIMITLHLTLSHSTIQHFPTRNHHLKSTIHLHHHLKFTSHHQRWHLHFHLFFLITPSLQPMLHDHHSCSNPNPLTPFSSLNPYYTHNRNPNKCRHHRMTPCRHFLQHPLSHLFSLSRHHRYNSSLHLDHEPLSLQTQLKHTNTKSSTGDACSLCSIDKKTLEDILELAGLFSSRFSLRSSRELICSLRFSHMSACFCWNLFKDWNFWYKYKIWKVTLH